MVEFVDHGFEPVGSWMDRSAFFGKYGRNRPLDGLRRGPGPRLSTILRRDRLDERISQITADSPWTPIIRRLGWLRGISDLTGLGLAVEIGDWNQFKARNKRPSVANTAIVRELAGWCWSLAVIGEGPAGPSVLTRTCADWGEAAHGTVCDTPMSSPTSAGRRSILGRRPVPSGKHRPAVTNP
ncbi:hypothetical protein [Propionibacterium sp.]|uniref:hypothetical protein n=1 Tax=Propionibacterium sp. TaxID=1977903 RepID=UPI0039E7B3FC